MRDQRTFRPPLPGVPVFLRRTCDGTLRGRPRSLISLATWTGSTLVRMSAAGRSSHLASPWAIVVAGAVAVALLLSACSGQGRPYERPTSASASGCTVTVTNPRDAQAALDRAAPGDVVCFSGAGMADADLVVRKSGTEQAPITLRGAGVAVRSVQVKADHVVVDGFTAEGGVGLQLQGNGLTARGNTVRNTTTDAISCDTRRDSLLDHNTVVRADGSGILISGERITVQRNDVSGSVKKNSGDADGIRFFGQGHRIADNIVHDISMDGYSDPPHPDCFQTFDNSAPSTSDITISGNRCTGVGQQCLIATAVQAHQSHGIHFVGNICSIGASQAVLLEWFPDVEVRDNQIGGTKLERGISLMNGSVNGKVVNNRFVRGGYPFFEADDSSKPGLQHQGNTVID
ncbi:right-handed parallel beta-helix repeat-containing protein [Saccharopolyspora rosea]|uniref:right-handed parallel beta-helix repeat-containing protein n=1 Tax=Saccharopolyspora rosea TaxID=524884 RepID=UPI0021DA7342|nr:right-handed parallel beta-helix repeat-containing protein [Saccharopolyspora rosea]